MKSSLLKIISLSGISTFIKIISGVIITKFIAVTSGPEGLAVIGNFRNITQSLSNLSTGGIENGVVKLISQNKGKNERKQIFSASLLISFIASISLMILSFTLSSNISLYFFNTIQFSIFIKVVSISLPFSALNIVLVKYLNGLESYNKVITINITINILNILTSILLIYFFELNGAIISIPTIQVILLLITILYSKDEFKQIDFSYITFDNIYIKQLINFSIISLASAISVPLTLLFIRRIIINNIGITSAGLWDSVNMISNNYFMFASMTMSLFLLPEFSKTETKAEIIKIMNTTLKYIFPLFLLGLITMFLLRDFIINLLLSDSFIDISNYLHIQFFGDAFKFISWIFAVFLISKAQTKYFVISELFSAISYITLSYILLKLYGSQGVYYAYTINYTLYLIIVYFYFRRYLKQIN